MYCRLAKVGKSINHSFNDMVAGELNAVIVNSIEVGEDVPAPKLFRLTSRFTYAAHQMWVLP